MSAHRESTLRTLVVALVVSLLASVFVAGSAVTLKPIQQQNRLLDQQRSILAVAGLGARFSDDEVRNLFRNRIQSDIIDLTTGEAVSGHVDLTASDALPSRVDIASIKRRERYVTIYRLMASDHRPQAIILPVRGYGLWSTLYGFLAIKPDLNTVVGLGFYQHGETPGLGGEVDNPRWKALWPGKTLFDAQGRPNIEIIKGNVQPNSPEASHQVDGLAGATLTSRGVDNLLRFWLGEQGFGPWLRRQELSHD